MRSLELLRLAGCIGAIAIGISATASASPDATPTAPVPLHPTVIYTTYEGQSLPIIGVSGQAPQVSVHGKITTLWQPANANYTPRRAAAFAPGEIKLLHMDAGSSEVRSMLRFSYGETVETNGPRRTSNFSAVVRPSQDYHDCFLALVVFEQAFLTDSSVEPNATVHFRHIADLPGGRDTTIELGLEFVETRGHRLSFFPLFFTRGVEIRTDQCELTARFFRGIEERAHEELVRAYLGKYRDSDQPLRPYLEIPPLFLDPTVLRDAPAQVNARLTVSDRGKVDSVAFDNPLPPEVTEVMQRTLRAWLFLPRLKEGHPVRTMAELPIALKDEGTSPLGGNRIH